MGYGSWPDPSPPQMGYGTWPIQNAPTPYFDPGPIAAAPMPQPVTKVPRRGRKMVAWCLWMLAIGLAAGPLLAEYADQGLEAGIEWLVKWAPNFAQPYLPKPLTASTPQASGVARIIPAAPSAVAPARAAPEQAVPVVATRPVDTKALTTATTTKTNQPERRTEQAHARKTRASRRLAAASDESAAPRPATKPARRPRGEQSDPFETGTSQTAKPERPAKAAAEPVAVKSKPARSGDPLDDLMADAASGTQPKDRRNTSKSIDAMLQDVQKSRPAPRPARAEPETLPSLTASDIARAMAGVKTGAKACGRRFDQSGVADLKLTVGKDGKVSNVVVRGKLANTPVSDCIAQAARDASFPPNSGLKFDYRIDVP